MFSFVVVVHFGPFWAIYKMIHGLYFCLCQKKKSGSLGVEEKINRQNFMPTFSH